MALLPPTDLSLCVTVGDRWCDNNAFGGHQPVSHIFREQSQLVTDYVHIFCDTVFLRPSNGPILESLYTLDVTSDIASNCFRP